MATAEFSFADEYVGPPLTYDLPEAIPIEIADQIPVACHRHSLPLRRAPRRRPPPPLQALHHHHIPHIRLREPRPRPSSELKNSSAATSDFTDFSSSSSSSPDRDRRVKKQQRQHSCHRCSKGSRFTEKEACLVCNAKYCINCLLRAMGSMPEGRKCVSCIGLPVEDSRRERLGRSSRMLRRLLSSLEVEQVMRAERCCEANQLRPEDVCVNRKRLGPEEMVLLQSCPCPPPKLKPGYYWYDKVSGFWGKEGHKPDKIISPNLNVGGILMRNASNGNTGILINGREITKVEVQMLKWARVQCAGNPHFWVNADGTYQEEGQKNIKGQIWSRATTKLLCSFLSLPVPSKGVNPSGEEVNNMLNRHMPDYLEQRTLQKLLLTGFHGSGTSTIFKQACQVFIQKCSFLRG
ncbi:extra-large guanine nucleotide-binding protein 1-like [Iris pallida]|uniref:Extra-large guanine nucleotide-binding protein 1-like n=1 Tax=Iris pallida TaxID=29817 RepID=A0AAX6F6J7_IRIPA|nr:extra-large guanine nucleotide-binding protein 1-like [Iris pallida]